MGMNDYLIKSTPQVKHYLTSILKGMQHEIADAILHADAPRADITPIMHHHAELNRLAEALVIASCEGENAIPFYIRFDETDGDAGWRGGTIIVPNRMEWVKPLLDRAELSAEVESIEAEIAHLSAVRDKAVKALDSKT